MPRAEVEQRRCVGHLCNLLGGHFGGAIAIKSLEYDFHGSLVGAMGLVCKWQHSLLFRLQIALGICLLPSVHGRLPDLILH